MDRLPAWRPESNPVIRKESIVKWATFLLASGLILAALYAERLNNERYSAAKLAQVQEHLAYVRSRLEGNLHGDAQLVKGLISVIAVNPKLNQEDFARAAKPLFQERGHLRNIGIAPDMVIQMMYPLKGNEKAIGLDYRKIPEQFEMADRARRIRQIVLAGPLQLVQGGSGIISRIPVYIDDKNGQEYFWGLISAVIDTDKLYQDSSLAHSDAPFDIAIRGKDAKGAQGEVFYGNAGLFESNPVLAEIPLPDGSWQMAAIPKGGWPIQADNTWQLRAFLLLILLLILGPFFALRRAMRATSIAQAQTESIKSRLSATLENTPNVAVQWYDQGGRIVYWNPASKRLFGWSAEEAIGKTLGQLIYTQKQARDFQEKLKRIGIGPIDPIESTVRHRNGQDRIIFSTIFPIPGEIAPLFVRMDVDITERKKAEAELVQAREAAEQANHAKSAFLTSMSHELRTPLNAIIGFSQILKMDTFNPLNPSQNEKLQYILNSGHHLLSLINEMLDLARIETSQLGLSLSNLSVDQAIEEAVALIKASAANRQISLHHDGPVEANVRADAARVQQILLNLLSNAVKYNRIGGQVNISSRAMNHRMRISIDDTGPGIPEHKHAQLFQPFQRLGAEKTATEGTGIGLVICKKLAEAMEGSIGFESKVGVGSRFWLELPIAPTDINPVIDATSAPATNPDNNLHGQVLYVEDDSTNVFVMQHAFAKLPNVELMIAGSAEEGLELIEKKPPQLVLMDINLPGISGLEALKILKSNPKTARIPVVAVSAAALPSDIETGLAQGFQAYLTKPFDVLKLIKRVSDILNDPEKTI